MDDGKKNGDCGDGNRAVGKPTSDARPSPADDLAGEDDKDDETELVDQDASEAGVSDDRVSQYVDLKPTASGAVGLCPFHDDHHPSFGVNDEGNYWNCWAGCGGGSVIDWWMKWRRCDFTTAVKELAEMVL